MTTTARRKGLIVWLTGGQLGACLAGSIVLAALIMITPLRTIAAPILRKKTPSVRMPSASANCEKTYDALFSKPAIKIRVVFGYKDARPARFVGDHHERLAFVERILAPCVDSEACGFTRSLNNADLFTKTISAPLGPGSHDVQIFLSVVSSSVGSDDEANRKDPFQDWQSHYSQAAFISGLHDADIVFYNGHSRFGGGPDFAPPKIRKDERVDTTFYTLKKPGITKMLTALRANKKDQTAQLKILGLYSCSSSQHFNEQIKSVSNAKLISSSVLVYYADAIENSLGAISSILQAKCLKTLN